MTKRQLKAAEKKVEKIYYANCSGIQINIMDIGKVFKVGVAAIANGLDDVAVTDVVTNFVETIRQN